MSEVFISYRKEDASEFVSPIYHKLADEFGVFIDFDKLAPGFSYPEQLRGELSACEVMLVFIGPRWLSILQERAASSNDWVRVEVETGLARGIPVIPVLVGGANKLSGAQLPESLQSLETKQWAKIRGGSDWPDDVDSLIRRIHAAQKKMMREQAERAKAPSSPAIAVGRELEPTDPSPPRTQASPEANRSVDRSPQDHGSSADEFDGTSIKRRFVGMYSADPPVTGEPVLDDGDHEFDRTLDEERERLGADQDVGDGLDSGMSFREAITAARARQIGMRKRARLLVFRTVLAVGVVFPSVLAVTTREATTVLATGAAIVVIWCVAFRQWERWSPIE